VAAFNRLDEPVLFPAHPRTRKAMNLAQSALQSNVKVIEPLGYVDMIAAASAARIVLTDSGGLQKEAYWLGVPCLTLRNETEWVETVDVGWNKLVGFDTARIVGAASSFVPPPARPPLYGDGDASGRCVAALTTVLPRGRHELAAEAAIESASARLTP
jgi:UDP-N-acetylglucosamine 2-epimerase